MTVGIIANPVSGKDIRRLVAQGSVFDNNEKVNILRRVLKAIDALGGRRAVIMPDPSNLGRRALDGLRLDRLEASVLDLPCYGDARDSTVAARQMAELGVGCIVTLGGDGTNRAVARGCGDVPLLPISTGTNNVFPRMVEGTVAGLAAEVVASRLVEVDRVTVRARRLEVRVDGQPVDLALVDVAASQDVFVGSRALWEPGKLREVVVAFAPPGSVGLASVGACLAADLDGRALYIRFGPGGRRVLAPLAPGLVVPLEVQRYRLVGPLDEVQFEAGSYTLALDGEREIEVAAHQSVAVRLCPDGPRVVDVPACLAEARRLGVFDR